MTAFSLPESIPTAELPVYVLPEEEPQLTTAERRWYCSGMLSGCIGSPVMLASLHDWGRIRPEVFGAGWLGTLGGALITCAFWNERPGQQG